MIGLLLIHWAEKIATYPRTTTPSRPGGWFIYNPKDGSDLAGPFTSWSNAHDAYANGPFQQIQNLTGTVFSIRQEAGTPAVVENQPLLSTDEAELAKVILTSVAATSGVGTLLKSLKG